MSFRDNLQHLRATRNMTQEQLAMLLGVSRQSVSKWEAEQVHLRSCAFASSIMNPACNQPPRRTLYRGAA